MDFDELKDPELQVRLKAAKTPEELLEIAKESGVELEDAQLTAISGGTWCDEYCPYYYECPTDGRLA